MTGGEHLITTFTSRLFNQDPAEQHSLKISALIFQDVNFQLNVLQASAEEEETRQKQHAKETRDKKSPNFSP